MAESRSTSPLVPDIEDDVKGLNESQDEENLEVDEDDEEYDDETQDPDDEDILASDGETEGEARLLDRREQLRMEEGGDALLKETQVGDETQTSQENQGEDTQMRGVEESDGSDSEPLAAKRPVTVEKRGRGRPPGKSTSKGTGEGASSSSKKVPISVDNPLGRQPGRSLFPLSRVTKVIKADKDIPMVAKDAAFLISLATEEFIRRLAVAGHDVATKENRTTMKLSDIVAVSKRIDEFIFLEDILPYCPAEPTKSKGNKGKAVDEQPVKSGPMNQFMAAPKQARKADEDVVMQDETEGS